MYTGELEAEEADLEQFLQLAAEYQVKGACETSAECLLSTISPENIAGRVRVPTRLQHHTEVTATYDALVGLIQERDDLLRTVLASLA